MSGGSTITVPRGTALLLAVVLLGAGAGVTYLLVARADRDRGGPDRAQPAGGTAPGAAAGGRRDPAPSAPTSDAPAGDVTITLSDEAVKRAGIVVSAATAGTAAALLRIPGVIEPNAYRLVAVTPLVGGRVTRVLVALGDRVRQGQTMAEVYSPELAEAQTQFLSFAAELEAAHQQLVRTERLVEIGAASRQELESVRAQHTSHTTHVEASRARLILLGLRPDQIAKLGTTNNVTAAIQVPAPFAGLVTERGVNPGLNVDASTKLFTVIDLSSVWVVGDLHERDFARVRVGSAVRIATTAYPELSLPGRVSYIDPQVAPDTRTARVRVEVGNPDGRLRLGMYAEMLIDEAAPADAAMVPKGAVQSVGGRHVVYVVEPGNPARFTERAVTTGRASDAAIEILEGIRPGDLVVSQGSFHVRAEIERLGLQRSPKPASGSGPPAPRSSDAPVKLPTARVTVTEKGFEPSTITLPAGRRAQVTFLRTTDKTCATEVAVPSLGLKRPLPLNEPVSIDIPPRERGDLTFTCGMNMLRGTIVVQ